MTRDFSALARLFVRLAKSDEDDARGYLCDLASWEGYVERNAIRQRITAHALALRCATEANDRWAMTAFYFLAWVLR